jgi:hypothetical protein
MVEYGHGVGEVSGGVQGASGGGNPFGGSVPDVGARVANWVGDTVDTIVALPPHMLVLLGVAVLLGLIVLRRAF